MLHVAGVDDVWERQDRLDLVLKATPEAGAAILLAHEPDFADVSAATRRFDLQISGHSHGGQVIIPLRGPPLLPRYAKKYPMGLCQVGSMMQYTNRGVGMVPPRVRFNCRSAYFGGTYTARNTQYAPRNKHTLRERKERRKWANSTCGQEARG